ncbi:unnamed protein product, partial [Effrenium voratum]
SRATRADGTEVARVSARGELEVRPWFHATAKAAVVDFYHAAKAWYLQGKDHEALAACEKAVKLADAQSPRPREMADALHLLGAIHLRGKQPALAVKCLERALGVKQMLEPESLEANPSSWQLGSYLALGSAHLQAGAPKAAAESLELVVKTLQERKGDSSILASAQHSLGSAYRALGQHDQSMQCYQLCLELRESQGDGPQLVSVLNNLGAQAQQLSRFQEAAAFYRRALELERKHLGVEHPASAATLGNLGIVLGQLKDHQGAVRCLEEALQVQEKELGSHPSVACTLHNLGNAFAASGQGTAAADCLLRALRLWQEVQHRGGSCEDIAATLHSAASARVCSSARCCWAMSTQTPLARGTAWP